MDYELTTHARKRMDERNITKGLLEAAIEHPTKMAYDGKGALLIKKLYSIKGKHRLLLIAGQILKGKLKIFTVIDTSKVTKYL